MALTKKRKSKVAIEVATDSKPRSMPNKFVAAKVDMKNVFWMWKWLQVKKEAEEVMKQQMEAAGISPQIYRWVPTT